MNSIILLSCVLALLLYWRWRNLFYTRLAIRYKYKFFALRDDLRMAAIREEIDLSTPAFKYLDSSISSAIHHMEKYNVITFQAQRAIMHADEEIRERMKHVHEVLDSTHGIAPFLVRYQSTLRDYFVRKHYFIRAFFRTGVAIEQEE